MSICIQSYTQELVAAVRAFNGRLAAGGVSTEFCLPEHPAAGLLPKVADRRIYQEYFLARERDSVRGAYILKHQDFSFSGAIRPIAHLRLPISEGIINKAYAGLALQMLRNALRAHSSLFALGMGGFQQPLPRMLQALGWNLHEVPFYFKVNRPWRFLRHIQPLRKTPARRLAMDLVASSGIGWLGIKSLQAMRAQKSIPQFAGSVQQSEGFSAWADTLWENCQRQYSFLAVRDSATLNLLYPPGSGRFICLRFEGDDSLLGWAVVLDTRMENNKYFGNLRVGSIVDCLARTENAPQVIAAAVDLLEQRGVDLIVSNQSHHCWAAALRSAGFLRGPSNFIFAASPKLADSLRPLDPQRTRLHLNRGDGDGPIHL